jgi:hypothetical protein
VPNPDNLEDGPDVTHHPSLSAAEPSAWWHIRDSGMPPVPFCDFIGNPFYEELYPELTERARADIENRPVDANRLPGRCILRDKRLINKYGMSAPLPDEIAIIRALGLPIAEIGAGKGYWARMLFNAGIDVTASDLAPPIKTFYPVSRTDSHDAARIAAPSRALLIVWPTMNGIWPLHAVKAHKRVGGRVVIYSGEVRGCCANTDFFDYMDMHYRPAAMMPMIKRNRMNAAPINEMFVVYVLIRSQDSLCAQICGRVMHLIRVLDMPAMCRAAVPNSPISVEDSILFSFQQPNVMQSQ